jgi:hypothetical protein
MNFLSPLGFGSQKVLYQCSAKPGMQSPSDVSMSMIQIWILGGLSAVFGWVMGHPSHVGWEKNTLF